MSKNWKRRLVLYTYSSDWGIEDHGGVSDGANPNMSHEFQVKESQNMVKFMPGDTFSVERDNYPRGLMDEIERRGYDPYAGDDRRDMKDFQLVLVNPRGKNDWFWKRPGECFT